MSGRMEIDTTGVGALARGLAEVADSLHTAARDTADLPPLAPSATAWADIAARHDRDVAAASDLLAIMADRAASVSAALVAAVGTITEQDSATSRSIIDSAGER